MNDTDRQPITTSAWAATGDLGSLFRPLPLLFGMTFALAMTLVFQAAILWSPLRLRLEHQLADWRTALMSDRGRTQHPRLAIVLIDDKTLSREPYTLPIDRRILARLVRALDELGAKAIGLDFLFYRPTEPDKDAELASAI